MLFEDGVPDFDFDQLFSAAAAHFAAGQSHLYKAVFEQRLAQLTGSVVPSTDTSGSDAPASQDGPTSQDSESPADAAPADDGG